jgi:hypothetical protein
MNPIWMMEPRNRKSKPGTLQRDVARMVLDADVETQLYREALRRGEHARLPFGRWFGAALRWLGGLVSGVKDVTPVAQPRTSDETGKC